MLLSPTLQHQCEGRYLSLRRVFLTSCRSLEPDVGLLERAEGSLSAFEAAFALKKGGILIIGRVWCGSRDNGSDVCIAMEGNEKKSKFFWSSDVKVEEAVETAQFDEDEDLLSLFSAPCQSIGMFNPISDFNELVASNQTGKGRRLAPLTLTVAS
jgi:hypothetical protein